MIETAKPEHLDAIINIWLQANISAHSFIPRTFWESAYEQVRKALPAAEVFLYRENVAVAGFIGISGDGYIAGLFVDAAFRSRGIGRQLLAHCKQRYARLELDVFAENTGAVRFYEANGFSVTQTKSNPDFAGHTEHHMVWNSPAKTD